MSVRSRSKGRTLAERLGSRSPLGRVRAAMKIAVCVKEVPGAARRSADRSRRRSGSTAPARARSTRSTRTRSRRRCAARRPPATARSCSSRSGPERALDALRKALAMGADRAVLVTDDARRGLRSRRDEPRARGRARARGAPTSSCSASRRATPTAPCSGPRSPTGCGCRSISQVAELDASRTARCAAKRQTEFGYDVIEAPLPAVVAVSDAINEPRYPSLKGIMGAKKKPQETRLARRPRARRRRRRRGRLAHGGARARRPAAARRDAARSRTTARAAAEDRRVPRGEEAAVKTLVFLEHHDGELAEGLARRAREGGVARRRGRGGRASARACAGSRPRRGATARRRVYVADDAAARRRRCRSRASTCSRSSSATSGFDTVLFAQSVLAADVAAGARRAARRGLNWDLVDLVERGRRARRQAAGARRLASTSTSAGRREPRLALFRSGTFEPAETRRHARRSWTSHVAARGLLARGDDARAGARGAARARRSRTPTSSSPAAAGSAARRTSRSSRSSRRRSAAPSPRRARSSTPAGTRTRRRSARRARPSRRSSTSPAASRARSSTRSACRARARSSRSTRIRTRRSSSSPTSASSATCTRSSRS